MCCLRWLRVDSTLRRVGTPIGDCDRCGLRHSLNAEQVCALCHCILLWSVLPVHHGRECGDVFCFSTCYDLQKKVQQHSHRKSCGILSSWSTTLCTPEYRMHNDSCSSMWSVLADWYVLAGMEHMRCTFCIDSKTTLPRHRHVVVSLWVTQALNRRLCD